MLLLIVLLVLVALGAGVYDLLWLMVLALLVATVLGYGRL